MLPRVRVEGPGLPSLVVLPLALSLLAGGLQLTVFGQPATVPESAANHFATNSADDHTPEFAAYTPDQ